MVQAAKATGNRADGWRAGTIPIYEGMPGAADLLDVGAELANPPLNPIRLKVLELQRDLETRFQERRDVVEGCLLAALSGEHVLLLGPPGTAKSALARALSDGLECSHFEWLLSRFSAPEELFGPISLAGLKADRYVRVTTGKLPECHIAFLDEIFKANSGILNSLLTAVNERLFHNGPVPMKIPLRMVVGASNELPEGPELGALYDRFLLRFWVDYVQEEKAFTALVLGTETTQPKRLDLAEWDQAVAEAQALPLDSQAAAQLFKLRTELQNEGLAPSDRRLKRCLKLVRAAAWLAGDLAVGEEHFEVLKHALWNEPGQRPVVTAAVSQVTAGITHEATKIQDTVLRAIGNLGAVVKPFSKEAQDRLVAVNREGKRALDQLDALLPNAKSERQKQAIKTARSKIQSALGPCRAALQESLGL